MSIHTFGRSLALSHEYADAPWWLDIYREAFPGLEQAVSMRSDGFAQRAGIDRRLVLSSGASVDVDEKVRDKDYDDFFLEYWSDRDRRTKGWVAKDLACHYIAYAFIPSGRCYLLPFQALRVAWARNREQWVAEYGYRDALNDGWVTRGCCVPIPVVLTAIGSAQLVRFTAERNAA